MTTSRGTVRMDVQIGMGDLVMALKRPITGFGEKFCTSRQGNVTADCLRAFLFFFLGVALQSNDTLVVKMELWLERDHFRGCPKLTPWWRGRSKCCCELGSSVLSNSRLRSPYLVVCTSERMWNSLVGVMPQVALVALQLRQERVLIIQKSGCMQ